MTIFESLKNRYRCVSLCTSKLPLFDQKTLGNRGPCNTQLALTEQSSSHVAKASWARQCPWASLLRAVYNLIEDPVTTLSLRINDSLTNSRCSLPAQLEDLPRRWTEIRDQCRSAHLLRSPASISDDYCRDFDSVQFDSDRHHRYFSRHCVDSAHGRARPLHPDRWPWAWKHCCSCTSNRTRCSRKKWSADRWDVSSPDEVERSIASGKRRRSVEKERCCFEREAWRTTQWWSEISETAIIGEQHWYRAEKSSCHIALQVVVFSIQLLKSLCWWHWNKQNGTEEQIQIQSESHWRREKSNTESTDV